MLNFCNFSSPVKSLPPRQFMWTKHDFWSITPGLPGGMLTLGIDRGIRKTEKVTPLCIFVARNHSLSVNSFILCAVTVRTLFYSVIIRKVKLVCMNLKLFWLENYFQKKIIKSEFTMMAEI